MVFLSIKKGHVNLCVNLPQKTIFLRIRFFFTYLLFYPKLTFYVDIGYKKAGKSRLRGSP